MNHMWLVHGRCVDSARSQYSHCMATIWITYVPYTDHTVTVLCSHQGHARTAVGWCAVENRRSRWLPSGAWNVAYPSPKSEWLPASSSGRTCAAEGSEPSSLPITSQAEVVNSTGVNSVRPVPKIRLSTPERRIMFFAA